jgi:hypothetical protein
MGGRVGRHPARIYSCWDMGNGRGLGEGETADNSLLQRQNKKGMNILVVFI